MRFKLSSPRHLLSCVLILGMGIGQSIEGTQLTIHLEKVIAEADLPQLLGTNLALWHEPVDLAKPGFKEHLTNWAPGLIRLPGGSWSNEYYWNGNGARTGLDQFNEDAYADGRWKIDYSDYAPGFRIHGVEQHLSDYHGVIDVETEHELAESLGAQQIVTVNAGTGSPEMAVEWLKWANQRNYDVPMWEIGNELNGQWETGHFLVDGSSMTGEIYAERFLEYAAAMKAVDPSIKVGGPASSDLSLAFIEELLRDGGDAVDFVTFHAYPVGVQRTETAGKFADIKQLREALGRIEAWKQQYQPDRADEIGIGITEWNMKVNEDRDTADLINGLWSAVWIGAMLEGGVTFANQWDLMTTATEGGHGAFFIGEQALIPKSHYWAHYIWGHHMGGQMLDSQLLGTDNLEVFVTRTCSALRVMLVNTSEEADEAVHVRVPQWAKLSPDARQITFSQSEYFWDPYRHEPLWSMAPMVEAFDASGNLSVSVPAFSIKVLELPFAGEESVSTLTGRDPSSPHLELILPDSAPADLPLEVLVVVRESCDGGGFRGDIGPVEIKLTGPVADESIQVELKQSVGRVFISPLGSGELTLHASSGDLKAKGKVSLEAVESRPEVIWTFDNPVAEWGASCTFTLGMEPSVKPNEFVAEAILNDALPGENADVLMLLETFPDDLQTDRIGGFIGEIHVSPELMTDDPKAQVNIILQSEADHWMPVGSIPLAAMKGKWEHFTFEVTDPKRLKAMARLYAVRFQIVSTAPVTGEIYFDNLGFLLRSSN